MSDAPTFLEILFDDLGDACIEVRLIEDRKNGAIDRLWFRSPLDLVAQLDRINGNAEREGRAVYFGVLPRRVKGQGTAAGTAPGWVAWADIDFKDVPEEDARARLAAFPVAPSILVHSGRGLHVYWLMREPTDPADLSTLSRRLAHALGADHCFDAARILRLPGTRNLKHLWSGDEYAWREDGPVCTIEHLDGSRRYNPCDFDDLPEAIPSSSTLRDERPRAGDHIADGMPAQVRVLLDRFPRLRDLHDGYGKSAGDCSNSGYDLSFAMSLVARGVTDADVLDAAVNARPRADAKARTSREVRRTVDAALARAEREREWTPPTESPQSDTEPEPAPPSDVLSTLDNALARLRATMDPRGGGAEEVKRIELELMSPAFIEAAATLPDPAAALLALNRMRSQPSFKGAATKIERAIMRRIDKIREMETRQAEAATRAAERQRREEAKQIAAERATREEWPLARRGPHPAVDCAIARTSTGCPRPTYANTFLVIRDDPRWSRRLRVNRLGDVVELDGAAIESEGLEIAQATLWLAQTYDLHVSADLTRAAIYAVAELNAYHPVRDYLEALAAHDRGEHIARILPDVFGIKPAHPQYDLYQLYIRRMLISAVVRVLRPGEKVDTALILVGKQGAKKSSFFKALFGAAFFGDSPIPIGDKNAAIQLRSTWGYELAEMASMKGKSAEEIKQFLSQASDLFRHIYEKNARSWPRHSILVGSVNTPEFLTDDTGSRRFWPIELPGDAVLDLVLVRRLRDAMWSEALAAARRALAAKDAGRTPEPADRWWFEPDEDVARAEDAGRFAVRDVWDGYVETWLEEQRVRAGITGKVRFTSADALEGAIGMTKDRMSERDKARMGRILKRLGYRVLSVRKGGMVKDGWAPALPVSDVQPEIVGRHVPTDDRGVVY